MTARDKSREAAARGRNRPENSGSHTEEKTAKMRRLTDWLTKAKDDAPESGSRGGKMTAGKVTKGNREVHGLGIGSESWLRSRD